MTQHKLFDVLSYQLEPILNEDKTSLALPKQIELSLRIKKHAGLISDFIENWESLVSTSPPFLREAFKTQVLRDLSFKHQLISYIHLVNKNTFNFELGSIRIGRSKATTLAYMRPRIKQMTISRFCLGEFVPERAIRYLIIHELAHIQISGHGCDFWELVEKYCPDYRLQQKIIQEFYSWNVEQEGNLWLPEPTI